ncbi:MAG: HPF/RaiA family ribosome-associated protein [Saccharospirillaceae bacterium]|nr:HPF/RaiA family ribosome-associated protein [Saccharospirillaceae bacterium]MCD8531411.1 HPF/RaiA family ribosome-associated protein [Saccharospirillaceae bacterium]
MMVIEIQTRNIHLSNKLRGMLRKRVEQAFDRLQHHVQKVCIRLADVNGPKGGIDKSCQFHLSLSDHPDVIVRSQASELEVAINKSAARSARALMRRIGKRRAKKQPLPIHDVLEA